MIAIDTNILVYAHRPSAPEHRRARQTIEKARAEGFGITSISVTEFLSVVTSPRIVSMPTMIEAAHDFLSALFELSRAAIRKGIVGRQLHDLSIAVIAQGGGAARLWTHDTAFTSVPGLKVEFPLVA